MAFTDVRIRNLKPKKERYYVWEDGKTNLGVRVAPSGRKTFAYSYRFEGRTRRMFLGQYPRIRLANARRMVAEAQEKLIKGVDPGAESIKKKKAERDAETVVDLAEEYLEKWARPRKRTSHEDERALRVDVLPLWGKRKAKDITRRDVIKLLDGIVDRGSPIQANRTLTIIRKMFNFAVGRDILDASPCVQIPRPSPENTRDRVLNENELKAFWNNLPKAKMGEGTRLALKFQLLTATRKGEIVRAEWSEIDLHKKLLTIPAKKSKNKRANTVPLSPQAIDILKRIKKLSDNSPWLFPSPRGKEIPVTTRSVSRAVKNNLDAFEIDPWVPHDLRRTAASHMTAMGIPRLHVSKVLNHTEGGVTAIYDRHSYDKEKRQALEAWGRKLESIVTGEDTGKVIEMIRK